MTPAGCQFWVGQGRAGPAGWPNGWMDGCGDNWIAGWVADRVLGWRGRELLRNNKVSPLSEHIQHRNAAL